MKKKLTVVNPDMHFKVLQIFEENPFITQRELSRELNVSLGAVNYCIRALMEVGHIKINNFKKHKNKANYFYLITPEGINEKGKLLGGFLARKIDEYNKIKAEIQKIQTGNIR